MVIHNWHIFHLDVNKAFSYEDLDKEIYIKVAHDYLNMGDKRACKKVHKFLYGLKQGYRQWNSNFTNTLYDIRFLQSKLDYLLFCKMKIAHLWL